MTNGDEGSAPMVIVLKYNADALRQCSRKLVGEVRDVAGRRVPTGSDPNAANLR